MLPLGRAADSPELRGGIVGQGSVRLDLAPEQPQQGSEIGIQHRLRELGDRGPGVPLAFAVLSDERGPGGQSFDQREQAQDLRGFECDAFDARFFEQRRRIKESMEVEAAAAGDHRAHLRRAPVLPLDPGAVGGRLESQHPGAPERRDGRTRNLLAQLRPFERRGSGLVQGGRDVGEKMEAHLLLS